MRKPRLVYYNDLRHYLMYRVRPTHEPLPVPTARGRGAGHRRRHPVRRPRLRSDLLARHQGRPEVGRARRAPQQRRHVVARRRKPRARTPRGHRPPQGRDRQGPREGPAGPLQPQAQRPLRPGVGQALLARQAQVGPPRGDDRRGGPRRAQDRHLLRLRPPRGAPGAARRAGGGRPQLRPRRHRAGRLHEGQPPPRLLQALRGPPEYPHPDRVHPRRAPPSRPRRRVEVGPPPSPRNARPPYRGGQPSRRHGRPLLAGRGPARLRRALPRRPPRQAHRLPALLRLAGRGGQGHRYVDILARRPDALRRPPLRADHRNVPRNRLQPTRPRRRRPVPRGPEVAPLTRPVHGAARDGRPRHLRAQDQALHVRARASTP